MMSKKEFFKRLKELDCYLCPEPGNCWSVCDLEDQFCGWGDTPEKALIDAEEKYKE